MHHDLFLSIVPLGVLALAGCALPPDRLAGDAPPASVEAVDLERYAGRWFEIARFPNGFEDGCAGVTAEYTPLETGRMEVINTCRKGGLEGETDRVEGKARVVESSNGAKLEVSFFGPFYFGDYWVIELDPEYRWTVVSEPRGRFLWILARTPTLPAEVLEARLAGLEARGFDTGALHFTEQWDSLEAAPPD